MYGIGNAILVDDILGRQEDMASTIRQFWRQLQGSIHPADAPLFRLYPHTFNLDFPPPAFVGDVDRAPIIILMANGGFKPDLTPAEFPDASSRKELLDYLKGERAALPENLSTYYAKSPIGDWIRAGKAVIVNAVAYRSPNISKDPENQRLGQRLPSAAIHRKWLRSEAIPDAQTGKRFIIVHRPPLWNIRKHDAVGMRNVRLSPNPISPFLAKTTVADALQFLRQLEESVDGRSEN